MKNLPTIEASQAVFSIGETINKYIDYKKDTKRVEYETEKLKMQTNVVLKQIDANLKMQLDQNKKKYKLEGRLLKKISKQQKSSNKIKREILKQNQDIIKILSNQDIDISIKELLPTMTAQLTQLFIQESSKSEQLINKSIEQREKILDYKGD